MAAYPSITQVLGSTMTPKSGLRLDRAVSGKVRAQTLYTADLNEFNVKHTLNSTDVSSLLSHYATDKLNSFNFTWAGDSNTYVVIYENKPTVTPIGGGYYDCGSRLVEVG